MKIIFATNNQHKLREAEQILGPDFELLSPSNYGITEEIPENEPTLEGNALQKARYLYERTGVDCFADDTGLEVDALGGEPGVRSARYASEGHDFRANLELLLKKMDGIEARKARFRTAIALIYQGEEYLFEGEIGGVIGMKEAGEGGFGYDPIFYPDGYSQSFAEMSPELKNQISHRARAMKKLSVGLNTIIKSEDEQA